jgi:hypothetical protein
LVASPIYFHELHAHRCHRTYGSGRQALIERAPREVETIALGRLQLDISVRDVVLATLRAV